MIKDLNKKEIFPGVLVYKNMFKDINNTFNIIKQSENISQDTYITKWQDWGVFGKIAKTVDNFYDIKIEEKTDQYEIINELFNNYKNVGQDYVSFYKDKINWPSFVNHFDLSSPPWTRVKADILKYDITTERDMALFYHVDQNLWKMSSGDLKFVLTVTAYINDDYIGGEISFLNDQTNEILTYRPEAGDIIVFPSFYPYYHGVLPVTSGNKYLFRMFHKWEYEGDSEWNLLKEKYGIEKVTEIYNNEIEKKIKIAEEKLYDTDNPDYSYDPNIVMPYKNGKIYKETYVDGRDND